MKRQLKMMMSIAVVMMVSVVLVACGGGTKLKGMTIDAATSVNAGGTAVTLSATTNPTSFSKSKLKWFAVVGTTEAEITGATVTGLAGIKFAITDAKTLTITAGETATDSFKVRAKLDKKVSGDCDVTVISVAAQSAAYMLVYEDLLKVGDVTIDDLDDVNAAKADFASLSPAAQALVLVEVSCETVEEFNAIIDALLLEIDGLIADEVDFFRIATTNVRSRTVETVNISDDGAVKYALSALNEFPDVVKEAIVEELEFATEVSTVSDVIAFFENLFNKIEELKAAAASAFLTTHGAVFDLTVATVAISDSASVYAAQAAFNGLNLIVKTIVATELEFADAAAVSGHFTGLLNAIAAIIADEAFAFYDSYTYSRILELADDVTLDDYADILATQTAFNALSDQVKNRIVDLYYSTTFNDAEEISAHLDELLATISDIGKFLSTYSSVFTDLNTGNVDIIDKKRVSKAQEKFNEFVAGIQATIADELGLADAVAVSGHLSDLLVAIATLEATEAATAFTDSDTYSRILTLTLLSVKAGDYDDALATQTAFNALNDEAKEIVADILANFNDAAEISAHLANLIDVGEYLSTYSSLFKLTLSTVKISDKQKITAARTEFNGFSSSIKAAIARELGASTVANVTDFYGVLLERIGHHEDALPYLEEYGYVFTLAVGTVTTDDFDIVTEAKAAWGNLSTKLQTSVGISSGHPQTWITDLFDDLLDEIADLVEAEALAFTSNVTYRHVLLDLTVDNVAEGDRGSIIATHVAFSALNALVKEAVVESLNMDFGNVAEIFSHLSSLFNAI